ncbi:MAG: esterase [Gammaproteobacteria bacterium]|nr:esterase [Gammaproteobacteria bacterium]MDP2140617.1 esterase [Gammaproteobacteria bacterium]MDP2347389.1 esterase [Gammaproteobacteria bacterium]
MRQWSAILLGLALTPALLNAAESSRLLQPSGNEAWIPAPGDSFGSYISNNETRIRAVVNDIYFSDSTEPFGPGYTPERVVQMRAPYEILPSQAGCATSGAGEDMGFLLIHGLTDSPYLLRSVANSLVEHYPCAIARGVLLPGHGTVPGDSVSMQHEDWMAVTQFGVESFRGQVEALFMVGFSTGTALSLRYVDAHRGDELISGLIMLSPALAASSDNAFLAQYLRWFSDWLGGTQAERDAAKYESFAVNAGAEFYQLTRPLTRAGFAPLTVPIFMAGSGDDTTVNMEAARSFFCTKAPPDRRRMIWYSAQATGSDPVALCSGIEVVAAESPAHRVFSLSHTSITIPPDDTHYGLDAAYSICLHYGAGSAEYNTCVNDDMQTVYGERNLGTMGRYEGKFVRRGSFNPHYEQLLEAIVRFVDDNK